jgi:hypothetical protein
MAWLLPVSLGLSTGRRACRLVGCEVSRPLDAHVASTGTAMSRWTPVVIDVTAEIANDGGGVAVTTCQDRRYSEQVG